MTYEDFLELKRKYRVCCEWNNTLTECNPDSVFIIADKFKTQIWYKNEDTFGVLSYGREKYIEKLKKLEIPFEYRNDSNGGGSEHEYFIDFKYFDKCIDIFNPKLAPLNAVSPFSKRNINLYLRFCRNIDYDYYNKKLLANIQGEED